MNLDDFLNTNLASGFLLLTHRGNSSQNESTNNNTNFNYSNLLDLGTYDFEERLQELLSQRSNLIQPLRLADRSANEESESVNMDCDSILKFCNEYKDHKTKLDSISKELSVINDNKKILNTNLETIQKSLYEIMKLARTDDNITKLFKTVCDDIYTIHQETLKIVIENEPELLAEQLKVSDYIHSSINLLNLAKKEIMEDKKEDELTRLSCPVCYEKEVNTVYVPCGHTICMSCCKKVKGSSCIICRKMAAAIPFYLST